MVFYALDIDSACTSLNGHSARESAFLFCLVLFHQATGDREQDL
jgi:hypothetical protein